jgi:WD40 repeat protein
LSLPNSTSVLSVTFSPNGDRVVCGLFDGTARVWTGGTQTEILHGHTGPVTAAVFAPRGDRVATGSYDQRLLIWQV